MRCGKVWQGVVCGVCWGGWSMEVNLMGGFCCWWVECGLVEWEDAFSGAFGGVESNWWE